jgi:hypothetical protein
MIFPYGSLNDVKIFFYIFQTTKNLDPDSPKSDRDAADCEAKSNTSNQTGRA